MSAAPYWNDTYRVFGPLFYDLIGYYELHFNSDPAQTLDYDKTFSSSEILPIYGEASLPKFAMYLSQLPLVDRLTEIKQLAYTYVIFPGATHTRYEHSRGVMYRGERLFKKIQENLEKECREEGVNFTDDDKIVLQMAALLHDLGHPAWGHALDGITGYVVQQLVNTKVRFLLYSPRKLDITITIYLLKENDQLSKALEIISNDIKDKELRDSFVDVVAQIIMEEEQPNTEKIAKNNMLLRKIHLLTTILGNYHGRENGINADRLDWFIRDGYHANLGEKLRAVSPGLASKYEKFFEENKNDSFEVGIDNCEYSIIKDKGFSRSMRELRESVYSAIYEGRERSFTDSLLIRLSHSTINVINNIGARIASAPLTARAVMGYLLMFDYLMKEYTTRSLHQAKQYTELLAEPEPRTSFIARSDDLLNLVDKIKCIMHYLRSAHTKRFILTAIPELRLDFEYLELVQIDKHVIIFPSRIFGELIEKVQKARKLPEETKLAILFHDIIEACRIDAIGALRVPSMEMSLENLEGGNSEAYLLANYYFFRKLDDNSRKITSFSALKDVLKKEMPSTPLLFIITGRTNIDTMKGISEKVVSDILSYFDSLFKSVKPFVQRGH